jgi:hypothetical protein
MHFGVVRVVCASSRSFVDFAADGTVATTMSEWEMVRSSRQMSA